MTRRRGSIKQETNGKWRFTVDVGPDGGPRQQVFKRGFRTRGDAQLALNDVLHALTTETFVKPDRLTVQEYLTRWLDSIGVEGRRTSTLESYRSNLALHVFPKLGGAHPQKLSPVDLDRLYATLRSSGRRDAKGGLSAKTVRYIAGILHKAFSDAVKKGVLVRNPAASASPPSAKSARAPEMSFWTPAELAAFLEHIRSHALFSLFRLVGFTGLRRGEAAGLRWADVDFTAENIRVRQQVVSVRYRLHAGDVKTEHSRRTIDLDTATLHALEQHRAAQVEIRVAVGAGWKDNDLVFCRPDGAPLHPDWLSKHFDRLVKRSGLKRIRFHDLRHSHASHLIAAGADLKAIQTRLGHASASFTLDRYGHLLPGRQAEAARAVAMLVDEAPTPSEVVRGLHQANGGRR